MTCRLMSKSTLDQTQSVHQLDALNTNKRGPLLVIQLTTPFQTLELIMIL